MQKVRVFYAPTQANESVLQKAIELRQLKQKCELMPLNPDRDARRHQLQGIEGRAIYVWGDGWQHGDSYFFTLRTPVRLKLNIDHHDDAASFHGTIACGNHMDATRVGGIEIITPLPTMFHKGYHLDVMRCALEAGLKRGMGFAANEVAVTVDADGIVGFPAHIAFLYDYGLLPREPIELVSSLGGRLARLDFGGLPHEIPDFNFIEGLHLTGFVKALRGISVRAYVKGFSTAGRPTPLSEDGRRDFDQIGTYATLFYARLLEAFAI